MATEAVPEHPNLPRRGPLAAVFAAIAVSGILGGLIGYGLVATTCPQSATRVERIMAEQLPRFRAQIPSCAWKELGGALLGTVFAALGAATIAILVLRAQSEWRGHAPPRASSREAGVPPSSEGDQT